MAINIKPSHRGLLHEELGVTGDKKIPQKKLQQAANSSSEAERKRAQFALNASHWDHSHSGRVKRLKGRLKGK